MIEMIFTDIFCHCEPIYRRGNLLIGQEIASASTMPRNDREKPPRHCYAMPPLHRRGTVPLYGGVAAKGSRGGIKINNVL